MFMAAGLLYAGLGHDRIADLGGAARAMPVTVAAFGVAGRGADGRAAGRGLSGEEAAARRGGGDRAGWSGPGCCRAARRSRRAMSCWCWAARCGAPAEPLDRQAGVAAAELAALGLALASLLLGLVAHRSAAARRPCLQPAGAEGARADAAGRRRRVCRWRSASPAGRRSGCADAGWRRPGGPSARSFEAADSLLRRWPVATLSLVGLVAAFGGLLRA